ncbi:penicillin-binding protein 2 [Leptolyngbya sp. BC1307]|uniref:peptidoglycan D,D-transpeptidase FtsI family protein n=1 Tax=Leptolyngbya sp. BC1307 TaxID=2029589 RepID=UPI000EFB54C5|nr:penicillin-binding protein 2 [Leptolyngbya sp. BC1307]
MAASTRSRASKSPIPPGKAPSARRRRPSARLPGRTPAQSRAFRLKSPRLRLITVWLVLIVGMLGLAGRLAYLQLFIGTELKQMAKAQQTILATPRAARRQMVDRQGNVVAMDQVVYTLYVHPMLFKKSDTTIAEALGGVLERSPQELLTLFAKQESGIKLSSDISEETAERLQGLRLDGLDLLPSPQRVYPQGELFSQITGYTDLEGVPQEGLELSLQKQLTYADAKAGEATPLQQVARDDLQLQLTIDSRLQRIAQENLADTVAEYGAKRGALLVMDAHTGEILTMAIAPSYNPNRYYDANIEYFKNWAVSDLYEPGSTFKPINVAIALENGSIAPGDYVYDEGRIQIGEWPIQNVDFSSRGGRGSISLTDVLRYSSNVGMVHVMETVQRSAYYDWFEKLGLGLPTGIELPGEASGQIKDRSQFVGSAVEAATTAFGQGFSLTPLQMVQLHGILANNGKMVTPHVVRGLTNADGELTWSPEHTAPRQIFSPETTRQVLAMMKEVVDDGTGSAAKVKGYQVAGKTGTAQKATEYGAYGNQRITSFVSIAPVSNPRYVVLAVIDEPQGENAYGGTVAAPLVKKMLESLVVLEGVAPDAAAPAKTP